MSDGFISFPSGMRVSFAAVLCWIGLDWIRLRCSVISLYRLYCVVPVLDCIVFLLHRVVLDLIGLDWMET